MRSKKLYTAGKSPEFKTIGDLVAWAAISNLVDGKTPIRLNGREIGRLLNDYSIDSESRQKGVF
jgi:hypothetical protein